MDSPTNTCSDCGSFHFYPWQCPFDLHGEDNFLNPTVRPARLPFRQEVIEWATASAICIVQWNVPMRA
jgi:hypothetical protein